MGVNTEADEIGELYLVELQREGVWSDNSNSGYGGESVVVATVAMVRTAGYGNRFRKWC